MSEMNGAPTVSPEKREKLERLDRIMREKFGVKWDRPAGWDWRQDAVGRQDTAGDPGGPGSRSGTTAGDPRGPGAGKITADPEGAGTKSEFAGAKRETDRRGSAAAGVKIPARTPPNRDENEFMMNLMILRNALVGRGPKLRERCRRAGKWIWRDVRLMTRLVCTVQDALMETMPKSREEYYDTYRRAGHYELVINGPVRPTRYVLISDRKLAALTEAAMCSECAMCMRDGAEIGKCLLREALLEVAPPTEVEQGRWRKCEYRRAAGQLIREEEVSI